MRENEGRLRFPQLVNIRVYLGFPFIGFMLSPFFPYIGIYIYIYINSLNNKASLFHNMASEHQA